MIVCPSCSKGNIAGIDLCNRCGQTLTDLSHPVPATAVEKDLLCDRISSLQPKTPLTVAASDSVASVLQLMIKNSIGCVMVLENTTTENPGKLLGIFSERDALLKVGRSVSENQDTPISTLMTTDPVCLCAEDKIAFALQKMNVGGYRHLPIMTNGQLSGVISIRDILNYLTTRIAAAA